MSPVPPARVPGLSALLYPKVDGQSPNPLVEGQPHDALLVLYTRAEQLPTHPVLVRLLAPFLEACAAGGGGSGAGGDGGVGNAASRYLEQLVTADRAFASGPALHVLPHLGEGDAVRLLFCCTGSLDGDVDDCRRFADMGKRAVARCLAAGITHPAVLFADPPTGMGITSTRREREYGRYLEVTLSAFLHAAYMPLQAREHARPGSSNSPLPLAHMTILCATQADVDAFPALLQRVQAVDAGKTLAKDVGGSDPERMAPLRCAEYLQEAFAPCPNIRVTMHTDPAHLSREYPLLAAVARASMSVPRHWPVVVRLDYVSPVPAEVTEHLYLVGKGVTYDTGGADIKYGGVMRGMSRDKCGAAACAGFMRAISALGPTRLNATAFLGFVRNSAGADNYVSDEVILSRAGVRVLVGNTDAEGRMVMADLLAQAKELACAHPTVPARLFTVATLTGHAVKAVGPYTISLDNGPAREAGISARLFAAGHRVADPFETSTLRREDFELLRPTANTEDVCQANDKPSTQTPRGHQYPAAFLSVASGLAGHGLDSPILPLAYTHIDCAGSAEEASSGSLSLPRVTGSPVAALVEAFCGTC